MSTLRRKKENHNTDKTMREKETEKGRNDGKSLRSCDVREVDEQTKAAPHK